jgi:hypothetical protein
MKDRMKHRLVRVALSGAALVALIQALGAGRKW